MTELLLDKISIEVAGAKLVDNVSLRVKTGQLVAILGPNGAGKTSLLRAALGLMEVTNGTASLDDQPVSSLSSLQRARLVSYLPQRRPLAWPNTVRDIVALGRFAHGATLGRLRSRDEEAVHEALLACSLLRLADRNADTLSGGELARVHFARAMAANTPLLVADEPVAALDPRHQQRIGKLLREFVANDGGALVVLHEIDIAARYADHLVWMKDGRVVAAGTPRDTLSAELLQTIYDVRAHVNFDEVGFDIRIEGEA